MTQEEYEKRLAELEAEADRRGCCIIPATPIPPPDGKPENPDNPEYPGNPENPGK